MAVQKIRVPQSDGEIVFTDYSRTGDEPVTTHAVVDHIVSPRSAADRDRLLQLVDGARLATPKEAGETPPEQDPVGGNTAGGTGTKG